MRRIKVDGRSTRPQHAKHLTRRRFEVLDVLEYLVRHQEVKSVRGEIGAVARIQQAHVVRLGESGFGKQRLAALDGRQVGLYAMGVVALLTQVQYVRAASAAPVEDPDRPSSTERRKTFSKLAVELH